MTAGATPKQITLFGELLERKQFPAGTNSDALMAQFSALTRKSASEWIDRALSLPNVTDEDDTGQDMPAPF